ncbi:MAG: DegV family protein [Chloroflexales bacterium]|nr:DegV family protein [Chloroflexales bacterium]
MARIKIITDSAADIPLHVAHELGVEVVPLLLKVDNQVYRAGIDISDEQFYELLLDGDHAFNVSAPNSLVFERLYRQLMPEYDYVFSIHISNIMGGVYQAALQARNRLPASMTPVEVIDSKTASMGLGTVVLAAAKAVNDGATPEHVAQLINSMIQHTHLVFFVDTIEYLEQSGLLTLASSVLGSMQRIKPLLLLDDGEIVPYERTRTRAKAIEGLYTFIEDFPQVLDVTVLYATTPEDVDKLLEKVEPIFPRDRVQIAQFSPSVASYLGPGAMGVSVFEGLE